MFRMAIGSFGISRLVFREYLKKIGRPELRLGDCKVTPATEQDSQFLTERLKAESKFNNMMVIILIVMFSILFGVGVCLVFYFLKSPRIIMVLFGGEFLSFLWITQGLHKLWYERATMSLTIEIVSNLPPEQAVKIVEILYYSKESKKKT